VPAAAQARPRGEWLALLEAAGVPCAPIHSLPEAVAHPQVQALGILQPVPVGAGERPFQLTALPMSIDGVRPAHRGAAPALGAHNAQHGLPPVAPPDGTRP
jgi:crotonobetainyl-CoA:carnitine CoA-transferase CaiB-like acyl-CoA transferase